MDNRLKSNISFSLLEKVGIIISQFISSVLLSKYLPRQEFGAIAVISGAYAFLQFINIAIENVLIKDYQAFHENIDGIISQFIQINLIKCVMLAVLCMGIAFAYFYETRSEMFIYVGLSLMFVMTMDVIISPIIIYSSLMFKQNLVTKVSLVRWTLNIIGLSFLLKYPTIKIVLIKDFAIFIIVLFLWKHQAEKHLGLSLQVVKINWKLIFKNITGYSLWVHLTGVVSNIVYKADAFILYYFVSLQIIGNYNIALSVANIASIIPSILINQNNVALSHCKTDEESKAMTGNFLRLSLYLGACSLFGFVLLGKFYLRIVSKSDINEIYYYLLLIVSGLLIVKMIISPLVSYINLKGDVKRLFFRVQLPLLATVLINYTVLSHFYGAKGAAASNLLNSLIWLIFIYVEIKTYKFKISDIGSFKADYNQVKHYAKKLLSSY